jgi:hypothetical protein
LNRACSVGQIAGTRMPQTHRNNFAAGILACVLTMAGSPLVGSRTAVHNMIVASRGRIIRSAARSAEKEHWEVTVAVQTKGNAATTWVLVGAPLDCSVTGRGEARAP